MSHNIALSGIIIRDLDLLAAVVKDLSKGRARLVKNQNTFRTYRGQDPSCDHAIVLSDLSYDIGIKRQKDGTFSLVADFSMIAMQSPFLARGQDPRSIYTSTAFRSDYDQAYARMATGALMQEYAIRVAEEQAAVLGRTTQRVEGKNGTIALEVMERA